MTSDMKELKDLQVGDEVAFLRLSSRTLAKVEEVTDTQLVVNGIHFSKETGWNINKEGGRLFHISVPKEEEIESLRIETMKRFIGNFFCGFKMYRLPVDKLEQIYNIIKDV